MNSLLRPFGLTIYPGWFDRAEPDTRIPPHWLVLEPLVAIATEIVVHLGKGDKPEVAIPPHTKRGNALFLDRSPDLVARWPGFWNAKCWQRGSISIAAPGKAVNWRSLFAVSEYDGPLSRYCLRESIPQGAVTHAKRSVKEGLSVFCLSASNGIEWLYVWSSVDSCREELMNGAMPTCPRFVRFIENGKFPKEIIVDRPPYNDEAAKGFFS